MNHADSAVAAESGQTVSQADGNAHRSDVELLQQFVEGHDQAAMAVLISRHGPLIMGLCRRLLKNEHDAADAFQATFLILLKKAGSLGTRTSLAGWLYGVAHRVATKSKSRSIWRQKREASGIPMTPIAPPVPVVDDETLNLIHAEICSLPEQFRLPLILCCLEGETRETAAERLGWTLGSLKGRLERARVLLQTRLKKRGVAYSMAALTGVLAQQATAEVPVVLASSTVGTLSLAAIGQPLIGGVISSEVIALTQGVLFAMAKAKLQMVGIAIAISLMFTTTAVVAIRSLRIGMQGANRDLVTKNDSSNITNSGDGNNQADDRNKTPDQIAKEKVLRQFRPLGIAMHNYHGTHNTFPASASYGKTGQPLLSWRVHLLPFIDEHNLYNQFKLDEPWDSPHNKQLISKIPATYAASENARLTGETYLQVLVGKTTAFPSQTGLKINEITDGLSNTILVVEGSTPVIWTQPIDLVYEPDKPLPKFGGTFKDGFYVGFADGSTRFISYDLSEEILRPYFTATSGDVTTGF